MPILPDIYPCKPDIFEATYSPAALAAGQATAAHVQPAPATQQAGEPAGTVGYTVHGTQYVNWRTKPPAHGAPLYTTPQPTQTQAVALPPTDEQIQEAEPLLDYAMQIAHERELRVTGFPHDEDGAKRVFEAAVMRHTATGAAQADSVQEDAALWHWLAEYLVGTRTDLDDEIVASETVNDLRKLVKAAIKQGEKQ